MDRSGSRSWVSIGGHVRWRFLVAMVGVVLAVLVSFDVPFVRYVAHVQRDRLVTSMERDAYVLAGRVSRSAVVGGATNQASATQVVADFFADDSRTAAVVDAAGYLVATSDPTARIGADYTNRPEIAAAILGEFSSGERESQTLGESLVYVAVPIVFGDEVLGAVRLSSPKSLIDREVSGQVRGLILASAISVALAAVIAFLLSGILVHPINRLRKAADLVAEGEINTTIAVEGPGEIRGLSQSFANMTDRVRNMLERQRSFAGDAAHQLRTPLTALRLRLEQAEDSLDTDVERSRGHVQAALDETRRLSTLTEQMLRLARVEGAVLARESVDVDGLVREVVEQWSPLAEEKGIRVTSSCSVSKKPVSSLVALREILGNYIDNAIEYSSAGSTISISAHEVERTIEFVVSDQGPGMTDEERRRAFDRFWRGADSAVAGSGLGLAIVAQLAEAATLEVELRAGVAGGLDAVVCIPFLASSNDVAPNRR